MKIKSVTLKTVITINGKEFIREEMDYTQSIKDARDDGIVIHDENDIFEWIESGYLTNRL